MEAFWKLLDLQGKKPAVLAVPKFIMKLETIPEIALSEEQTIKITLALAKRGLVGKFMGLWPSSRTTDN